MKELKSALLKFNLKEKDIKKKNIASILTIVTEIIKSILIFNNIIYLNDLWKSIYFLYAVITTTIAIIVLINNKYHKLSIYMALDISELLFFLSNIIGGVLIGMVISPLEKKVFKTMNLDDKTTKIEKIKNNLYNERKIYIILFILILLIHNFAFFTEELRFLNNEYIYYGSLDILFISVFYKDIKESIKQFRENKEAITYQTIMMYCITIIASSLLFFVISKIVGAESTNEQAVIESNYNIWQNVFVVGILAPIFEELLWRGCLRKVFNNDYIFILITGIGFGLWHVLGYEQSLIQYLYIIPYSVLGIGLGYAYAKNNNILQNTIIHMTNNLLASIAIVLPIVIR